MGSNNVHNPYFVKLSQNCFTSANNATHLFSVLPSKQNFDLKDIGDNTYHFKYQEKDKTLTIMRDDTQELWPRLRPTDLEWKKTQNNNKTYLSVTWADKQHLFPQHQIVNDCKIDQWGFFVPVQI